MLLTSALISGIGLGSMYGLIALGFYLTYAVSGTVNFAQGSSMMLGAVLTFAFAQTLGWPFALAVGLALVLCAKAKVSTAPIIIELPWAKLTVPETA